MLLQGCAITPESKHRFEPQDGELAFDRKGCILINAKYTDTSGRGKGLHSYLVIAVSESGETLQSIRMYCNAVEPYGTASCGSRDRDRRGMVGFYPNFTGGLGCVGISRLVVRP